MSDSIVVVSTWTALWWCQHGRSGAEHEPANEFAHAHVRQQRANLLYRRVLQQDAEERPHDHTRRALIQVAQVLSQRGDGCQDECVCGGLRVAGCRLTGGAVGCVGGAGAVSCIPPG